MYNTYFFSIPDSKYPSDKQGGIEVITYTTLAAWSFWWSFQVSIYLH